MPAYMKARIKVCTHTEEEWVWRQITGSHPQKLAENSHNSPGQAQQLAPTAHRLVRIHQPARLQSANKQTMSSQFQVKAGPQTPWVVVVVVGGMLLLSERRITKTLPQTPPCWHARSSSSTRLPALPHTNTLGENADGGKGENKTKKKKKPNATADSNGDGAQRSTIMTHLERSTTLWVSGTIALHHVTFLCVQLKKTLPPSTKKPCIIASKSITGICLQSDCKQGCAQKEI